jgi:D-alanyl-D-alanine carboxypeptidase
MKPALAVVLSFLFVLTAVAQPARAGIENKNPRYAAFVINSDTGEVLYSRNGDAKRYPASLTKMMTLYLLFEALQSGKIQMNQKLQVSAKAASQPQTNISLRVGDQVPVQDAIKALVVRSANDVAVVVAEAVGGSEVRFAQMMTNKARQLGMESTVFRNPHGLPDIKQYTTARDMSRLGIALRKDFPQYYQFFKTPSFTWKGTTYHSHNRVMGRYNGADGIKTGFINMSGFNVVTSVKRNGHNLVGVVMGGQSGQIRDNHMISLLDQTYTRLAERGDQPRQFAEAPVPVFKPSAEPEVAVTEVAAIGMGDREEVPAISRPVKQIIAKETTGVSLVSDAQASVKSNAKPDEREVVASQPTQSAAKIASNAMKAKPMTLEYQMSKLQTNATPVSTGSAMRPNNAAEAWGIQVGAYTDERSALDAAAKALDLAREHLKDSKVLVTDNGSTRTSIHRARLANLSEYQAKRACQRLVSNNTQCFVYKADGQRL